MNFEINFGVFPTMITPFTEDNKLDYFSIEKLVEYYINNGCAGIFAVCQSSEMFFLSDTEKSDLMKFISKTANGRLQLVASGHTSDDIEVQIKQLAAMRENGAQASVIVLNRLANKFESEDVVKKNLEYIMRELPDITFGIYECPYPYKRTASEDLMKWCAQTDRIVFIKETSCDIDEIRKKCEAVKDTPLKIYNANTATLMDSLRLGVNGYSGIMANFHADLYVRLLNWIESDTKEDIEGLNSFLTLASLIEHELYPVNAKYRLKLEGIPMGLYSRMKDYTKWTKTMVESVKAVYHLENNWR